MKHFGLELVEEALPGLLLLAPRVFGDDRGYFMETHRHETGPVWLQDNESMSHRGVLRGMHFQRPPHAQAKLVSVVQGAVYDVAVDLRKNSPSYGQHFGTVLSAENHRRLYIPASFAHGFLTLEDHTIFQYKCSAFYAPESEGCLDYLDQDLNIDWLKAFEGPKQAFQVSEKDQHGAAFASFNSPFEGNDSFL
ncbi:dTDP-4-dehydrorhamnose 3,5-epimerase [Schleiferiaceae bacterium]|nr:dTDP-4-dehydrorhamnose 3,5-epimerase [Schleiferiaceae bacterium]